MGNFLKNKHIILRPPFKNDCKLPLGPTYTEILKGPLKGDVNGSCQEQKLKSIWKEAKGTQEKTRFS